MAELITRARMPHGPMRKGETYLKRQMFKVEDGSVKRVAALYVAAYRDVRNHAMDLADQSGLTTLGTNSQTTAWREALMAYVTARMKALADSVTAETARAAAAALAGAYYGRLWLMDVSTKPDVRIQMPMLKASDITRGLHEDVYSDLIQSLLGKEWRLQYGNEIDSLVLDIRRSIGQGMVNGDGVETIMRQVADNMGVTTDRRRGMVGSTQRASYRQNFNRVQTITRTTINQLSNAGAINAYEANKDVLTGYEWLTSEDERVCDECEPMDGQVFDFGDLDRPPLHPNCRCTVIPVVREEFLAPSSEGARVSLDMWSTGFGMDHELDGFLHPQD